MSAEDLEKQQHKFLEIQNTTNLCRVVHVPRRHRDTEEILRWPQMTKNTDVTKLAWKRYQTNE